MKTSTIGWIINLAFGGLLLVFFIETLMVGIPAYLVWTGRENPSNSETLNYSGEEVTSEADEMTEMPESLESSTELTPSFQGDQILAWTRPLAAFLMDSEHVLYAFDVDGTSVNQVYESSIIADDSPAPQLSPDGGLWIVTSRRSGALGHYLLTADGNDSYELRYQGALGTIMDWSPDSTQILVSVQPAGNWDVMITDREGIDWQVVANHSANEIEPRWSPDGSAILFQSDQDGNQEIYRIDPDGSSPVNLTNNPAEDKEASWAVNGARIIFTSNRDGIFGLYSMNRDGDDLHLIAKDPDCGLKYTISPDGEHILYTTDPYYLKSSGGEEITECHSSKRFLISLTDGSPIPVDVEEYSNPRWSPDGKKLLFSGPTNLENGRQELYVYDTDGSGLMTITPNSNRIGTYVWSPDGSRIILSESELQPEGPNRQFISIMDASGENRRELAPLPWDLDIVIAYKGLTWP
jgi:TolB protein